MATTDTVVAPKAEKIDAKAKDAKDAAAKAASAANDRLKSIVADLVQAFADQTAALRSIQNIPASDKLEELTDTFADASVRITACRDRLVKMAANPQDRGAFVTLIVNGERLTNEATGGVSWSPSMVLSTLVKQQKVKWAKVTAK
jgi:hypothetical protein